MSAKPKAKAMPTTPTLSPATATTPHPKNTRIKVPTNSARYFFIVPSSCLDWSPRRGGVERVPRSTGNVENDLWDATNQRRRRPLAQPAVRREFGRKCAAESRGTDGISRHLRPALEMSAKLL